MPSALMRRMRSIRAGLFAATAVAGLVSQPAAGAKAQPYEISPYVERGDEMATYDRAASLALLGRYEAAEASIHPLIERGYPPALRYQITRQWNPEFHTALALAAGCERRRSGDHVPVPALERLALSGDEVAIDGYLACMLMNWGDMRRTDWKPGATLWLLERAAKEGSWTRASELFRYYLAGMGLRTSPDGLNAKSFFNPRDCGFRCRKPDLGKAAEIALLIGNLVERDQGSTPLIYVESSETLTWAFVARKDGASATRWARITAQRAEYAANLQTATAREQYIRLADTMKRVADLVRTELKED